jgi:hypothetical protein
MWHRAEHHGPSFVTVGFGSPSSRAPPCRRRGRRASFCYLLRRVLELLCAAPLFWPPPWQALVGMSEQPVPGDQWLCVLHLSCVKAPAVPSLSFQPCLWESQALRESVAVHRVFDATLLLLALLQESCCSSIMAPKGRLARESTSRTSREIIFRMCVCVTLTLCSQSPRVLNDKQTDATCHWDFFSCQNEDTTATT